MLVIHQVMPNKSLVQWIFDGQSIMKANTQTLHFPVHSSTYPLHQSQDQLHRWPCVNGWGGGGQGFPTPLQGSIKFQFKSHVGYVVTQGRNTM